jgi:hypothetical protein
MNWFLNTGRKPLPAAPESSVTFRGNGQNIVYIDWDNDLVVVVRWINTGPALNEFIGKVLAAMNGVQSSKFKVQSSGQEKCQSSQFSNCELETSSF